MFVDYSISERSLECRLDRTGCVICERIGYFGEDETHAVNTLSDNRKPTKTTKPKNNVQTNKRKKLKFNK